MTFWTEARIEELKRLAPNHTGSEIAHMMGAPSRNVIIGKIHRLKLALNPDKPRGQERPMIERRFVPKTNAGTASREPLIRSGEGGPSVMPYLSRPGAQMPCPSPADPVGAFSSASPVSTIGGRYQCTLAFLTEQTCRFPCWDDSIPQDDRRYCGGKAIEGLPYCRTHADLCYTGQDRSTLPMRRFA